jgi:hypothetical protein
MFRQTVGTYLRELEETMKKRFGPYVAKSKIRTTHLGVREQRFGGTRFSTRGLGIPMQK